MRKATRNIEVPCPTNEECVRIVDRLIQKDVERAVKRVMWKYELLLEEEPYRSTEA